MDHCLPVHSAFSISSQIIRGPSQHVPSLGCRVPRTLSPQEGWCPTCTAMGTLVVWSRCPRILEGVCRALHKLPTGWGLWSAVCIGSEEGSLLHPSGYFGNTDRDDGRYPPRPKPPAGKPVASLTLLARCWGGLGAESAPSVRYGARAVRVPCRNAGRALGTCPPWGFESWVTLATGQIARTRGGCACAHVCAYVCLCAPVCAFLYSSAHTCTRAFLTTLLYVSVSRKASCVYGFTDTQPCTHLYVHVWIPLQTFTCAPVCTRVSGQLHVCIYPL